MNKQNDPLASLWQSQPVQKVDAQELKRMWQKHRTKQRLWFASDVFGMLFTILLCIYVFMTDDNLFKLIWVGFFLVVVIVLTPWLFKLRLRSLGGSVPTSEYLERIIEQKGNNIRVMEATARLCIFIAIVFAIWSNGYYFYYEPPPNIYLGKVLKSCGVILFCTFAFAWYIKRDIAKNYKELAFLSKLSE